MVMYAAILNYHNSLLGLFLDLSSGAMLLVGSEDNVYGRVSQRKAARTLEV